MFRKRWRSRNWWQDDSFDLGYGSSKRWKNKVSKKPKKKRCAWQSNFDFLPDLDEQYDILSSTLPLIGVSSGASASAINVDDIDDLDTDNEVLIGSLRGEIVGIQYYKGTVNNYEMVNLVREPMNQYDPNAVKVTNVAGQQVGHIKRGLAKALAFLLDFHLARVEGVVPFGSTNVYTMPVDLTFWGSLEKKAEVINNLRKQGFIVQDGVSQVNSGGKIFDSSQPQRCGSGSWSASAPSRRTFLTPTQVKSELDNLFEHLDEGDKLTEAEPCAAICTTMFSHQKQALSWMIRSENSDRLPPFWQNSGSGFLNTLTSFTSTSKPPSISGGILADDMGLGKTLEIIALVLTNFKNGQPLAVPVSGKIRPSRIAKDNRLKIYRQSVKEDLSFEAKAENSCSKPVKQQKCTAEDNFCFVNKSETAVDMSVKPLSKPVGPKKLLLLPNVESRKSVINVQTGNAVSLPNSVSQLATSGLLAVPQPKVQILPNSVSQLATSGLLAVPQPKVQILPSSVSQLATPGLLAVPQHRVQSLPNSVSQLATPGLLAVPQPRVQSLPNSVSQLATPGLLAVPQPRVQSLPNSVSQVATSGLLCVPQPIVQPTGVLPTTAPRMLIVKIIPKSIAQAAGVRLESQKPAAYLPVPVVQTGQLMMVSNSNVENQALLIKDGSSVGAVLSNQKSMTLKDIEDSNSNSECRQGVLTAMENHTSKANKDTDYCPNLPATCIQLVVSSRPKRSTRKPACYGDYVVDEDTPAKKSRNEKTVAVGSLQQTPAALVLSCDQNPPITVQCCDNTGIAVPTAVNDLIKNNDVKKHMAKNSKKAAVQKTKKRVPMVEPVIEQLVIENQSSGDVPALPTLPSEWIDTVLEHSVEITSQSSFISSTSSTVSSANTASLIPSAQVAPESSGSWLFANSVPSSSCASIQPAIMIDNSSDEDDELPDLPDLDIAQIAIPAAPSLTDFGKTSGRTQSKGPRATLIICPLSTLSNWLDQLEQHVDERVQLQVYTYYGPSRTSNHANLGQHDIVLTTYQTLAADVKSKGPLQKVHWLRLVLDEGHTIRNANTQMSKAVFALKADRKWVVTVPVPIVLNHRSILTFNGSLRLRAGTPIQNSIKDLWSLMKFLNVQPFPEKQWWDRTIERPVVRGDENAMKRVQNLLGAMTLRRMKNQIRNGKPIVELPKKDIFIEHITLSDEERQLYDTMQNEGKLVVNKYVQQGTLLKHYGEVLAIMMRLRQMCCHPFLVVKAANVMKEIMEQAEANGSDTRAEDFRKQLIEKILMVLNSGCDEECPICLEGLKTPVITHCAHLFCRICIEQVISSDKDDARCPMCRGAVSMDTLVEVPPDYNADRENEVMLPAQQWYSSSKVDALMNALLRLRSEDKTIKSIIVSQFTSYLTLIETPLRNNGFHFVRLDGSMSSKQRTAAIEAFSDVDSNSPTIFLLSLKAGGVGINLNAACRIFLMDPAWNPATEEQCFDRCHRLGQTRDVVVTKFVVENSVEEKMLLLQEKKRKLAAGVFGSKPSAEEKRQNRIQDIKDLVDL